MIPATRHRVRFTAALLTVLVLAAAATASSRVGRAAATPEELTLVVGEQRVLAALEVASFSDSTRGVLEIKVPKDGRSLVLTAVRPGATSLLLINRSGEARTIGITVFAKEQAAIENEILTIVGRDSGLSLKRVGQRLFVDGSVPNEEAKKRLERVLALYQGQVESIVRVDPSAVRPASNIRLDLHFVGLRRRAGSSAGLHWPGSFGGGTLQGSVDLTSGALTATYKIVEQALPTLEAAARFGYAKIRRRATVLTTSGHRADYLAGGEVNVAIAGSTAAELRTIPYGAKLSVLPYLDGGSDRLDVEVEAEVSELTETTESVPGRSISRVKTLVHLGAGQSLVLSGLDGESSALTKSGLPGLSRIPIFGLMFGTRAADEQREEGLIIITPTVLDNVDRYGKRLLDEAVARFESFSGEFEQGRAPLVDGLPPGPPGKSPSSPPFSKGDE